MNQLLQSALAEEQHLMERLEAVRAVIRLYSSGSSAASLEPEPDIAGRQKRNVRVPSATTNKIKTVVAELLHGRSSPTPTRDIIACLAANGIEIGGKNPIATLSALLSHAEEFEPVGRKGWLLISRTPDADTPGAASTGGDAAPLFERQKEGTSSV
jgi:hypothetical protein